MRKPSRVSSRRSVPALLVLSGLSLSSCASAPSSGVTPKSLAVAIPATCEKLLTAVPLPPVKATDDARAAFLADDGALIAANRRIGSGRNCIADVRKSYAKGK